MNKSLKKVVSYGVDSEGIGDEWWSKLQDVAGEIVSVEDEDRLRTELVDAEALFLSLGRGADKDLIESAPGLRYIGMLGTGYGRIDVEAARAQKVTVTNVADYSTDGVAEFVFGALLANLRELGRAQQQAEGGDYDESGFAGSQLSDRTIGVLGLGNIGRRVAEIAAQGFGADVVFWSRSAKEVGDLDGVREAARPEDVIANCDVLSLHLEHNPETDGFLESARLGEVPDGAIVVNTAPMELIELPALEKHLEAGRFSLILDHSDEMDPDDAARLARYGSCTVYPPIAYTTKEATEAKKEIFVTNLLSFLDGGTQNVVS